MRRWIERALLAACALSVACSGRGGSESGASTPRRVTVESGYDGYPAVSADGQSIVFSSDRSGAFELYVLRPEQGGEARALTSDRGQNVEAEWSPDGAWIAYHSRTRGGLWIVAASGGAPRKLSDTGSQPSWSPDGERLVFGDAPRGAPSAALWTIAADGTDRRALTEPGSPAGAHHHPGFSRDGRHVAFAAGAPDAPGIFVVSAQGGAAVSAASGRDASHPRFSPHDDAVYWTGADEHGRARVWRTPVERGRGGPIGSPDVAATFDAVAAIDALSVDRNGTAAVGIVSEAAHLWAVDVAPDGATSVPIQLTDSPGREGSPMIAAGDRVAFTRRDSSGVASPWTMNIDGSDERPASDADRVARPLVNAAGDRVHVMTLDGVENLVWAAPTMGARVERTLTTFTAPGDDIGGVLWTPARPRVIFERVVRRASVWTVVLQRP